MPTTLEQRLSELEKKVEDLMNEVHRKQEVPLKDWREAGGALEDDDHSREVDRLGAELRVQQCET
ncbi:MAG: hypothetical protein ACI8T1_001464 [Verrucomicrobiales bacterium]|jgi:hypothetical protein